LSIVNKYGFDFDGATGVEVYINPSINGQNFENTFNVKRLTEGVFQIIYRGYNSTAQDYIDMRFQNDNTFQYNFATNGHLVNIISDTTYMEDDFICI